MLFEFCCVHFINLGISLTFERRHKNALSKEYKRKRHNVKQHKTQRLQFSPHLPQSPHLKGKFQVSMDPHLRGEAVPRYQPADIAFCTVWTARLQQG